VLLVDKPPDITSHDAIARARRVLGTRRIGHLGTLDPFATGLLVLLVGRVTRLASYIDGEPKVYEATICFGAETTTDDITGTVTTSAPLPELEAVTAAIPSLTGEIQQEPPAFSAKQVGGVRAYAAARRGTPLTLRPANVTVHDWTVRGWRDGAELDVTITCGGGTYIRALARDLGRLVGSAAHLTVLRRTKSGPWTVADAVALADLATNSRLRSPMEGLRALTAVPIGSPEVARIARGQSIDAQQPGDRAVLTDGADGIVAIAERQGGAWAPRVVLRDS
jgi:tRNA pseudouridine55 synthase